MFESDLRNEQRNLQQLTSDIRQKTSRYESRLCNLKRQFDKVNGSAENQIKQLIAEFKTNIDSVLRDYERMIDKELSIKRDSISKQEANAIKYLKEYRDRCKNEYLRKAKSLSVSRGEL